MNQKQACGLWLGGCEVRKWAKLTQDTGIEHVGLNYRYLRERTRIDRFAVEKRFPPEQQIWLDPGTFGISQEQWDQAALEDYLLEYVSFAETNLAALTYVTELDATALGVEWISSRRNDCYGSIPSEKLVVVWHPEHGIDQLRTLLGRYENVAIPTLEKGMAARVHGIVRSSSAQIMGLRMNHPFELPGGLYKAILSTSWISPAKYGETHVWDHSRMRRYGPSQKDVARQRHARDFELAGFDPEKIQNDDPIEVPRYTLWAWQQLEQSLAKTGLVLNRGSNGKGATPSRSVVTPSKVDFNMTDVDTSLADAAQILSEAKALTNGNGVPALREPLLFPGLGFQVEKVQVADPEVEGKTNLVDYRIPVATTQTMRQCGTCSLKGRCPGFEEGADCRYSMPVEIRSSTQLIGALQALLEVQYQRIAFARFSEDIEGGYPNPNTSEEIDRFFKLVAKLKDVMDNRDTLSLEIKAKSLSGGGSIMQRFFGTSATEPLRAIDADAAEGVLKSALG